MIPKPLAATGAELDAEAADAAPGAASAAITAISAMNDALRFPELFLAMSPSLSRTAVDERTLCRLCEPCLPLPGEAATQFTRSSDKYERRVVA